MKKNINTKKSAECVRVAPVSRNRNFYDEYVEDIVSSKEREQFEKHLENCLYCSRQTVVVIKLDREVRKILTPRYLKRSLKKKLSNLSIILKGKTKIKS